MGPVEPPQRKGRLPQYARGKLVELQEKFDKLEELGVFKRPEDIGISVEYLNPSFLVKKPNGGSRLVTAFADVGRYSKPQPALLPDVDSTLRLVAQWKHIIATNLTSAFYQIPLARGSMKYCGVATPFKGVRVYARSAMVCPALKLLWKRSCAVYLAICCRMVSSPKRSSTPSQPPYSDGFGVLAPSQPVPTVSTPLLPAPSQTQLAVCVPSLGRTRFFPV